MGIASERGALKADPAPGNRIIAASSSPGYLELVRRNANFRNLWFGQVISQLGDWFDTIAVFTLVLQVSRSVEAAGFLTLARFLPSVILGPVAGVAIDRVDRKRLMIATDLLRAVIVLGFLLVNGPGRVWLIYLVTLLQFGISSFFEPARSALLPSVADPDELIAANAITSVTWSVMLTLGGAIGGAVTHYYGLKTAFLVDSLTFAGSALFLSRIKISRALPRPRHPFSWGRACGWVDLREGWIYLKAHPTVRRLLFIKPAWCLSSGGLILLLTLMGDRMYRIGSDASAGMSILYTARGIGAALGPVITRKIAENDPNRMRKALAPAFLVAGGFHLLLGFAPNLWLASAETLLAHMGGSVLWVFSATLLQRAVPDEYRGRVFATELCGQTLTVSLSTCLTSALMDRRGIGIRPMVVAWALWAIACAFIWKRMDRSEEA